MKKNLLLSLLVCICLQICNGVNAQNTPSKNNKMIRIAELQIAPDHLEEYKSILKEEAAASMAKESGVIAIFPMYEKEHPTLIRILEIYANQSAYEAHLKTPHFQLYKTSTAKMVVSLKLIEMESIDAKTMTEIFSKLNK